MCSLNFGLIRDEPSRDLIDENDTEFENIRRTYTLKKDKLENCKTLLVTTCKLSEASVKIYLESTNQCGREVGSISENDCELDSNEIIKRKTVAKFVRISDDLIHCSILEPIHMAWQNEFTKEVLNFCSGLNCTIVALTSERLNNFVFPSGNNEGLDYPKPITRILKTPDIGINIVSPLKILERPNIVHGVAAAVLTSSLFAKQKCLLVCAYTDLECLDSFTLAGFVDAFQSLKSMGFITQEISPNESKTKLKKLASAYQDSALYV